MVCSINPTNHQLSTLLTPGPSLSSSSSSTVSVATTHLHKHSTPTKRHVTNTDDFDTNNTNDSRTPKGFKRIRSGLTTGLSNGDTSITNSKHSLQKPKRLSFGASPVGQPSSVNDNANTLSPFDVKKMNPICADSPPRSDATKTSISAGAFKTSRAVSRIGLLSPDISKRRPVSPIALSRIPIPLFPEASVSVVSNSSSELMTSHLDASDFPPSSPVTPRPKTSISSFSLGLELAHPETKSPLLGSPEVVGTPPPNRTKQTPPAEKLGTKKNLKLLSAHNQITYQFDHERKKIYSLNGTKFKLNYLANGDFHSVWVPVALEPTKNYIDLAVDPEKGVKTSIRVNLEEILFKMPLATSKNGTSSAADISKLDKVTFHACKDLQNEFAIELALMGLHFAKTYIIADPAQDTDGFAIVDKMPINIDVFDWANLDSSSPGKEWVELEPLNKKILSTVQQAFALCATHRKNFFPDFKPDNAKLDPLGKLHIIDLESGGEYDDICYDVYEWASGNRNVFKYLIAGFKQAEQVSLLKWFDDPTIAIERKAARLKKLSQEITAE